MRRAVSIDDLMTDPFGHYVLGTSWISFVAERDVAGVVLWGTPSGDDVREIERLHTKLRPVLPRHGSLVDARAIEAADSSAFVALGDFMARRGAWLAEVVTRMALVRAGGLVGAVAAGFFDVRPAPFEVGVFEAPRAALEWLGYAHASELSDELDTLLIEATGTPTLLRCLRARLDARPGALSLRDAANAMALSERSLQRKLAAFGTSFQSEQNQAQVRVAKLRLVESDAPLTHIAIDVGCASLPHFSALFRKLVGVTPTEFRAAHRRAEPR